MFMVGGLGVTHCRECRVLWDVFVEEEDAEVENRQDGRVYIPEEHRGDFSKVLREMVEGGIGVRVEGA